MKKIIAFDLDGTLAPSKSPLPDKMGGALAGLLEKYQVCVISGGKFEQFEIQLINNLHIEDKLLTNLHIMPTCGTRYYRYNNGKWAMVYAEDFTEEEKDLIIESLQKGVKHFGFDREKTWGEQIEDRGSQITFSALGQEAPVHEKEKWDPTKEKKVKLRDFVANLIPGFEVRAGGSTSIDITKLGIDKAYGMKKLMSHINANIDDILFIGDMLEPGGNDYPVKELGIDSISVRDWQETVKVIQTILLLI